MSLSKELVYQLHYYLHITVFYLFMTHICMKFSIQVDEQGNLTLHQNTEVVLLTDFLKSSWLLRHKEPRFSTLLTALDLQQIQR